MSDIQHELDQIAGFGCSCKTWNRTVWTN